MKDSEIGYVLKGYPRTSETFITNEIYLLEQAGLRLSIFSLKTLEGQKRHGVVEKIVAPVTYLPETTPQEESGLLGWLRLNLPNFAGSHWRLLRRRPAEYFSALAEALRMSLKYRARSFVKEFLQAGFIALKVLESGRIRHLHAHFCHTSTTVTMLAARLAGVPFSFTAHAKDIYREDMNPGDLLSVKLCRARFAVTCTGANQIYLDKLRPPQTPLHRIYHGLDLSLFSGRVSTASGSERLSDARPLILSVGRMVEKKGFPYLVEACRLLKDDGYDFNCRIVGGADQATEAIERAIERFHLQQVVSLHSAVTQEELRRIYEQATVFALPCQVIDNGDRDGIPNVLVEAMAMELPVISTRISGIPELIEDRFNGLLVPQKDARALAAALKTLLDDAALRGRLGRAARETVRRDFDAKRNILALKSLFSGSAAPQPGSAVLPGCESREEDRSEQNHNLRQSTQARMHCAPRLLDAAQMRLTFEQELGCRIEDCQIARAKLRPGRNCLLTYRLRLSNNSEQLFSLLAFSNGESAERFAQARRQALVPVSIGKALFHLPEFDAVMWAFPNDRKLTGLPALTDSETLKELLPEVVANAFGEEWKIVTLSGEVVSYAAERACTVRVKLALSNSRTGASARQTLFGKTYCPGEGEAVWRAMNRLWQRERLLIPRPLGFQARVNTLWQQGLTGKTLGVAGARKSFPRDLAKAAATVAALHRLSVPDWPLREAVRPLEALAAAETLLARAVPACRPKLQVLIERLTDGFEKLQPRPAAILHGDLHLKNFLATGEGVALIDWDNVCAGNPMQELGSFAASLEERELAEGKDAGRWADFFIEAYFSVGRTSACRHDVDRLKSVPRSERFELAWHTAAALIYERAQRQVIRLNADAPRVIDGLLERARQLIEACA